MKLKVAFLFLAVTFFSIPSLVSASEFRFPVGLSYVQGFNDVVDLYKDNLKAEGYNVQGSGAIPVGLSAKGYYQFDSGFGFGVGFGPMMIVSSSEAYFFGCPLHADIRYTLLQGENTCPYIRAGVQYSYASGDYVKKSSPGFLGAIGVEFLRNKRVGFGLEFAVTTSKIEFEDKTSSSGKKEINPAKFLISAFAVF